jgi:hypothetical protein
MGGIVMDKPKCKLPTPNTVSFLIGNTVTTLQKAGQKEEMRKFINAIKRKDVELDYFSVFEIAEKYVSFY